MRSPVTETSGTHNMQARDTQNPRKETALVGIACPHKPRKSQVVLHPQPFSFTMTPKLTSKRPELGVRPLGHRHWPSTLGRKRLLSK